MQTEKYKNFTIKIGHDEVTENPREWDNIGTIYYKRSRYTLGDEEVTDDPVDWFLSMLDMDEEDGDNLAKSNNVELYSNGMLQVLMKELEKTHIVLPVYAYIHSGVVLRTTPFSCRFDSGQSGYIIVEHTKAKEAFQSNDSWVEMTKIALKSEIEIYSQFLNGEVYYWSVEDSTEEFKESVGGYYSIEDAIEEAKNCIDALIADAFKERIDKLKVFIKNNVPLTARQKLLSC